MEPCAGYLLELDPEKYEHASVVKLASRLFMCASRRLSLWYPQGSTAILEASELAAARVGFRDYTIRFMRGKQNHQGITIYHNVAC